ncbi:MAG: DUF4270 domain-containing protein [Bacteroidales bacterium]|nr:DUF4270 domain-containing protein [Bacteroidales bacterium]
MALLLLAGVFACNKQSEIIGLNLVEGDRLEVGLDTTISLFAYSEREDSTRTDELDKNLLGSYYDPVFGRSTASFYTQVRLSVNAPAFGDSPVTDSVILTLIYSGYYGNTSTVQDFKVHEITEDMVFDSAYYSFDSLEVSELYAEVALQPKPEDSLIIDSVKYAPRLSFHLDNSFGDKILNATAAELSDNEAFQSFFKGLYVSAETVNASGEGAILYFNLLSADSRITIYYNDSLQFDLNINESCARYNRFKDEYHLSNDPLFLDQVVNGDTSLGSERLYLSGLTGIRTLLFFPGLKNWIESGNIVINQARLILPVVSSGTEYDPPSALSVYRIEDSGLETYTDDQYEGEDYLGGDYLESDGHYFFRISLHLQNLINETYHDNGLSIKVTGRSSKAGGTVIAGTNPLLSGPAMQLRIIYSVLE